MRRRLAAGAWLPLCHLVELGPESQRSVGHRARAFSYSSSRGSCATNHSVVAVTAARPIMSSTMERRSHCASTKTMCSMRCASTQATSTSQLMLSWRPRAGDVTRLAQGEEQLPGEFVSAPHVRRRGGSDEASFDVGGRAQLPHLIDVSPVLKDEIPYVCLSHAQRPRWKRTALTTRWLEPILGTCVGQQSESEVQDRAPIPQVAPTVTAIDLFDEPGVGVGQDGVHGAEAR